MAMNLARVLVLLVLAASFGGRAEAGGLTFGTEEVKIKVKKPEAERLFSMANLRPEYKLELRESFLPQVIEALESKPF
jgi:hypothetical protein